MSIKCKVKDEFVVNKYRLLGLDEPVPLRPFAYYLINGIKYSPVVVYDSGFDCIAVADDGKSLVGMDVDFV